MLLSLAVCFLVGLVRAEWELKWEDEFDEFNHNLWQQEMNTWGGGNMEFQVYTNLEENVYTKDGKLYLKPTLTNNTYGPNVFVDGYVNVFHYSYCTSDLNWGCYREQVDIQPVLSGRIRTLQRFSFKHGKLQVEAKLPKGDWLWPAIWLLPTDNVYGDWPRSGEIDLVEAIGNRDLVNTDTDQQIGISRVGSTLHWGPAFDANKFHLTHNSKLKDSGTFGDDFHVYEFEWNEKQMIFRIDDEDILKVPGDADVDTFPGFWALGEQNGGWGEHTNPWTGGSNMAPFDEYFHIVLNVAVGGLNGFIPENVRNGGAAKPWQNTMTQAEAYAAFWGDVNNWYPTWQGEGAAMQVKSVRYYQDTAGSSPDPRLPPPCPVPQAAQEPGTTEDGWVLRWQDEFNCFDHEKWQHEITAWGGGNFEFQVYTNHEENVYIKDGTLFIKPTLTVDRYGPDFLASGDLNVFEYSYCSTDMNWGCRRAAPDIQPVLSGRIRTFKKFSFKYGKLVIDAKLPKGDWLWPAIWLLPEEGKYGDWPRSGEIDLVEAIGNRDLVNNENGEQIGISRVGSTLHWGPAWDINKFFLTHESNFRIDGDVILKVPGDDKVDSFEGFWEWGLNEGGGYGEGQTNPWTEGTNLAPFDEHFHIVLNVAVGGLNGFIPEGVTNGGNPKPWSNSMSQRDAYAAFWNDKDNWYPTWQGEDAALQVRSVKYYDNGEGPPPGPSTPKPTQPPISGAIKSALSLPLIGILFTAYYLY